MAELRRGFKTWCENAALGYRRDLGLGEHDALNPRRLAEHLGVAIWSPHDIPGLDKKALDQLTKIDLSSWSAVTLTVAGNTIIITNCSHSQERENSNIAHEISHIILRHEPSQVFVAADGSMMMREYNQTFEAEAECLSAVLLVPRTALLHMLKEGLSDPALAKYFGVSMELLRMRINLTGVRRQMGRRAAPTAQA